MAEKILIVDDDRDFVTAVTAALEMAGYAVISADSGAAGVAAAQHEQPDAVILDVTMETAGAGFNAARALRQDDRTRDIPVIMLTSINRTEAGLRYDADEEWNPVDKFLDKPLSAAELVEEVTQLLENREG